MTIKNYHRFESLPVWNYKRNGDPTMEQLHIVGKKRRAVKRRDTQRAKLLTVETMLTQIANIKSLCEAS